VMMPFEWVVGDSSKDHTVTAPTSTTRPATARYTTMRDSTRAIRRANARCETELDAFSGLASGLASE